MFADASDPEWERPLPPPREALRADAVSAVLLLALSTLLLALLESYAGTAGDLPRWAGYAMLAAVVLPLSFRRVRPIAVLMVITAAYMSAYYLTPQVVVQSGALLAFFIALYTVVAWGRPRQAVRVAMALFAVVMIVWIAVDLAVTSSYSEMLRDIGSEAGPFEPMTAFSVYSFLLNALGFAASMLLGWGAWRSALREQQNRDLAQQVLRQSEQLARRAVQDERMRIARELHDVIAHHVSAIGIQAGAARKVLLRDADQAQEALRTVEASSRQAVEETQKLLGILREHDAAQRPDGAEPERCAQSAAVRRGARLEDLEQLVAEHARHGLQVTLTWAVDPELPLAELPPGLSLSMYRCVQEALANAARHSTAVAATVVVRSVEPEEGSGGRALELEVLDRGEARPGTSGTGYGLVGLRERVHLQGGQCEIGPRRHEPGWRVRARFPLPGMPRGGSAERGGSQA